MLKTRGAAGSGRKLVLVTGTIYTHRPGEVTGLLQRARCLAVTIPSISPRSSGNCLVTGKTFDGYYVLHRIYKLPTVLVMGTSIWMTENVIAFLGAILEAFGE